MNRYAVAAGLALAASQAQALEPEISGRVGVETRLYSHEATYAGQSGDSNLSLLAEPEFYWQWNGGDDSLVFQPYLRLDQHDSQRSHADIRELLWTRVGQAWEFKAGIGKVFWGVTEFQHLVDVVNQTDAVEAIDGEDKLGQPLLNLALIRDWGVVDLMLLPGFRERTFPGADGRLRGPLVVDTDQARYQSAAAEHHLDLALRWKHTLGDYDLGLSWFHGTNREPVLLAEGGVLIPLYEQMDQLGVDLQATLGDWLWKFEALYRDSDSDAYGAAQGGFEYTLVGIGESATDLGLLLEYGWDSRDASSTSGVQNDLFMGARLTFNDMQSSELLAGIGQDLDHNSHSLVVEASRRLGESWKLSADAQLFASSQRNDALYALRHDDLVQITLERYF